MNHVSNLPFPIVLIFPQQSPLRCMFEWRKVNWIHFIRERYQRCLRCQDLKKVNMTERRVDAERI